MLRVNAVPGGIRFGAISYVLCVGLPATVMTRMLRRPIPVSKYDAPSVWLLPPAMMTLPLSITASPKPLVRPPCEPGIVLSSPVTVGNGAPGRPDAGVGIEVVGAGR
jgi:hypothetical protein